MSAAEVKRLSCPARGFAFRHAIEYKVVMTPEHQFQLFLAVCTVLATCAGTAGIVYLQYRSQKRNQIRQWLVDLAACLQSVVALANTDAPGKTFWPIQAHGKELDQLYLLLQSSYPDLVKEAAVISKLINREQHDARNSRNEDFQNKVKALLTM
jgi:hypothetical protein